ncbi:DedA family protein [Actinomadura flavalba]|uniref:DedA family protein n=1 Tax=Actinomadura flavalba TaxID=1120938 RepID=UPI0003717132|nr:hypothetical protein [Actinomadura flavalba]
MISPEPATHLASRTSPDRVDVPCAVPRPAHTAGGGGRPITALLDQLAALPLPWLLAALALLLAAESGLLAGLLLPGAATALTAGFVTHPAHGGRPLVAVCVTVVAATAAGAHWGYLRGTRTGPLTAFVRRRLGLRHARALAYTRSHPGRTIFTGHCTGGLRTLLPRLAAEAGVPYRRFALVNAAGAVTWGAGLVLAGRTAGTALDEYRTLVGFVGAPLVVAVAACWFVYRRRLRPA